MSKTKDTKAQKTEERSLSSQDEQRRAAEWGNRRGHRCMTDARARPLAKPGPLRHAIQPIRNPAAMNTPMKQDFVPAQRVEWPLPRNTPPWLSPVGLLRWFPLSLTPQAAYSLPVFLRGGAKSVNRSIVLFRIRRRLDTRESAPCHRGGRRRSSRPWTILIGSVPCLPLFSIVVQSSICGVAMLHSPLTSATMVGSLKVYLSHASNTLLSRL